MPERPGRWDLLGRDRDPVIVDVPAIDERVAYFRSLAESMREQSGRLARIGSGESLRGEYADELRDAAESVSKDLAKVVGRYEAAVAGLTRFRPAVDAVLTGSNAALDDAIDAAGEAGRAEAMPEAAPAAGEELTAQQQQENADRDRAVQAAAGRLAAAKARLGEALAQFEEAGRAAARVVRDGFDDGLTDSWVDRFVAAFKKFLKILVEVLTYIGMALAVLAVIIPGVGPLLLAGAVIGAVALAAEVLLILMGEGSWLDLGLAIAGIVTAGVGKIVGPAIKSGFRGAMNSIRGTRNANPLPDEIPLVNRGTSPQPSPAASRSATPEPTPVPSRAAAPEPTPAPSRSATPDPEPSTSSPARPPGVPEHATPAQHPDLGEVNNDLIDGPSFETDTAIYTPMSDFIAFKGVPKDRIDFFEDRVRDPGGYAEGDKNWSANYIAADEEYAIAYGVRRMPGDTKAEQTKFVMENRKKKGFADEFGGAVMNYRHNQPVVVVTSKTPLGNEDITGSIRKLGLDDNLPLSSGLAEKNFLLRNPDGALSEETQYEYIVPWKLSENAQMTRNFDTIYDADSGFGVRK